MEGAKYDSVIERTVGAQEQHNSYHRPQEHTKMCRQRECLWEDPRDVSSSGHTGGQDDQKMQVKSSNREENLVTELRTAPMPFTGVFAVSRRR